MFELRNKCVYYHRKLSDGEVFYVGVGDQDHRPQRLDQRNPHWDRVVAKHGVRVQIVLRNLTMQEVWDWEVTLIAFFGRENLVNMTDGGPGMPHPGNETRRKLAEASGRRVHTEAEKEKRAASHRGMKRSDEARKRMSDAAKVKVFTEGHRNNIGKAHKGLHAGMKHPQVNKSIFKFTHKDGAVEVCTMMELRTKYPLDAGNLWSVCYGPAKSHLGWKAEGPL